MQQTPDGWLAVAATDGESWFVPAEPTFECHRRLDEIKHRSRSKRGPVTTLSPLYKVTTALLGPAHSFDRAWGVW